MHFKRKSVSKKRTAVWLLVTFGPYLRSFAEKKIRIEQNLRILKIYDIK